MKTMKLFKQLFICFMLLFIFVSYMSNALIMSTYTLISQSEVVSESPKVEIVEAKSTNVNGFVIGKITNNTDSIIDGKYIKLDFYSEHDNNIGTKYLKVENLDIDDSKEFKVKHRFWGVTRVEGEILDEIPESQTAGLLEELSDRDKFAIAIGGLIVTYYMPARFLFGLFPI